MLYITASCRWLRSGSSFRCKTTFGCLIGLVFSEVGLHLFSQFCGNYGVSSNDRGGCHRAVLLGSADRNSSLDKIRVCKKKKRSVSGSSRLIMSLCYSPRPMTISIRTRCNIRLTQRAVSHWNDAFVTQLYAYGSSNFFVQTYSHLT